MKNYIKLIRVKHWLKNLLVFLPIFFSKNILNTNYLIICLLAFIVFCFASSIIYVLNDMSDIEKDKLHPIKKNRPLASGKISKKQAWLVMIFLASIISIIMYFFYKKTENIFVILIPLIYIVLNIFYKANIFIDKII